MPNRPVANRISRSSRTSIVADRLCGSVPITTCPTTLPPFIRTPLGSSAERATLLRAGQTPLEPLPASGARRDRTPWTSHTNPPVGSREESVPSSTSTEAWPGAGRGTSELEGALRVSMPRERFLGRGSASWVAAGPGCRVDGGGQWGTEADGVRSPGSAVEVQVAVTLGDCRSPERQCPGEHPEAEAETGHLGEDALRPAHHPAAGDVVGRLVPRADQAAVVIDVTVGEVGAQMPAPSGDREVPTAEVAHGVAANADHAARRQIRRCADSLFRTHRDLRRPAEDPRPPEVASRSSSDLWFLEGEGTRILCIRRVGNGVGSGREPTGAAAALQDARAASGAGGAPVGGAGAGECGRGRAGRPVPRRGHRCP